MRFFVTIKMIAFFVLSTYCINVFCSDVELSSSDSSDENFAKVAPEMDERSLSQYYKQQAIEIISSKRAVGIVSELLKTADDLALENEELRERQILVTAEIGQFFARIKAVRNRLNGPSKLS